MVDCPSKVLLRWRATGFCENSWTPGNWRDPESVEGVRGVEGDLGMHEKGGVEMACMLGSES